MERYRERKDGRGRAGIEVIPAMFAAAASCPAGGRDVGTAVPPLVGAD